MGLLNVAGRAAMLLSITATASGAAPNAAAVAKCRQHNTHEECTLLKTCAWNEFYEHCGLKGEDNRCEHIFVDDVCLHEGCIWNDHVDKCHAQHDVIPCDHANDENGCSYLEDCEWKRAHCQAAGQGADCPRLIMETDCTAFPECYWHSEAYECTKQNEQPACDKLSEEKCSPRDDCAWNEHFETCQKRGVKLPCELVYDQGPCDAVKHCSWREQDHICHRRGLKVACNRITSEESCKESGCEYIQSRNMCFPAGYQAPCDYHTDSEECSHAEHNGACEWNDGALCCHPKGMKLSCNRFFEQDPCEANGCDFVRDKCHTAGSPQQCDVITTEKLCYAMSCQWSTGKKLCSEYFDAHPGEAPEGADMYAHLGDEEKLPDCSQETCPNEPTECPEDEVLSKHTFECCKRCAYPVEVCASFSEEETCPDRCEWHQNQYHCGGLGEPVPCDKNTDQQACSNENVRPGQCEWHKGVNSCVDKGGKPKCERYWSEESCGTDAKEWCHWDGAAELCWESGDQVPCERYYDADRCAGSAHCEWNEHAMACHLPDEVLPCDRYYNEAGCAHVGDTCVWYPFGFRCLTKGEKPPCDILTLDECGAHKGCGWNEKVESCQGVFDFEPLTFCHEHWDSPSCISEGCVWAAGATLCVAEGEHIDCEKFYQEEGCLAHIEGKCEWHADASHCFPAATELPCEKYQQDVGCTGNARCQWNDKANHCHDKGTELPCATYYGKDECNDNKGRCDWNQRHFKCLGVEELIPCNMFFEERHCDPERCQYFKGAMACADKGTHLDCARYHHQHECITGEGCKWFPTLHQSTLVGHKAVGLCGKTHENHCMHVHDMTKCTEEHNSGCAWDDRHGRCRKLRSEL